jgi:hypothetical protein
MYLTLCPLNGPRAFEPREVRVDGSTMADVRIEDKWILYDRSAIIGSVDVVKWADNPVFVATEREVMYGVTETHRENWKGVI